MKALLSKQAGNASTLVVEDVPRQVPTASQVLVAVEACGVNYPDNLVIQDLYQVKVPRPFSPGSEVCGRIVAIGAEAVGWRVGQRVIARCGWGGMAEYVSVAADKCIPIDEEMPAEHAACFLFGYATSYHSLKDRARLAHGETVLVLGAGGGVGAAAVELAHALGTRVLAAASSPDKVALARRLGAADAIVYERDPPADHGRELTQAFKRIAGPAGVDVVFDPVGGGYSEPALRSLNPGGRHLVVGFTAGIPSIPINLPLLKSCQIVGVDWRDFNARNPEAAAVNARELLDLYNAGRICPAVTRRFTLEDGASAIEHLASRSALGRVVVIVNDAAPQ